MAGLVNAFIPFGKTMDLIFAVGGCFLFSAYIVYDTYMINAKLSPDEFIMGAISLYLECVISTRVVLCYLLNRTLFLPASSTSVSPSLSSACFCYTDPMSSHQYSPSLK
jgi:Inhibitor of apoptosis-promoting Bax1